METKKFLVFLSVFIAGAITALAMSAWISPNFKGSNLITGGVIENPPGDHLTDRDILVYPDKVVIKVFGATISNYESTGSMKPLFDKGANGIRIKPQSEEDIKIGDIVTFKNGDNLIVHRVIEKGSDEQGFYVITKGDNNDIADGKIRFEDIEYITIGLIY